MVDGSLSKSIIAIFSDITRIMEAEAQGRKMRSQFFSSIAHELRTPLNSILPILMLVLKMLASGNLDIDKLV